ncbi:MAG: hypothetical protein KDC98_23465 [Planctomycetes bacterium]|nr:hypothetical protein [Planctomycetota bacterium]
MSTRSPILSLIAGACVGAGAALSAQQPLPNAAGFGALYRQLELDPITGNTLNLGVAVDDRSGHFFVSGAGAGSQPPHWIYELDGHGALQSVTAQPAVHAPSSFGIRDLEFDGASLIGGSEYGISVFSPAGALVNAIETKNGPQPITQPITGPVAQVLSVFRAVALDPQSRGGNGSLLVADFGSPIYEIDFQGNILATFHNRGWSAYGLTIDPVTGNPWVLAGPFGMIEELDRATMMPTGHRLETVAGGAPGGLALASSNPGHHEPWAVRSALVSLVQGAVDRVAVQRLHLFRGVPGWNELQLRVGRNGGPTSTRLVPFWNGDTLQFEPFDPTGLRTGQPVWIAFNVYADANRNAYTDLSQVLPGVGVLWEQRSLSVVSLPSTATFFIATAAVGSPRSWSVPATVALTNGDLFRMQGLYFEPASPQSGIASTNQVLWQVQSGVRGIVVAAAGVTSFNAGQAPPFWTVTSDTTHGHGAITAVEFSTIGATGQAALQLFDIDQNNMNDRFDGGNATAIGHVGTYRNGSDVSCGLDYAAAGVYVAGFHLPGESAGVRFSIPPDPAGYVPDLHFAFTGFVPGRTFAFDCDTDGGGPGGADQAGMIVRVTTTGSGVLTGVLAVDPVVPDRSLVWFP